MPKRPFIKIYKDALPVFFDLSRTQLKILLYIMDRIRPGDKEVGIVWSRCMKEIGLTHKGSFYVERDKLIKQGILSPTDKSSIWGVNTSIFSSHN